MPSFPQCNSKKRRRRSLLGESGELTEALLARRLSLKRYRLRLI
jgi:hypothetical protein